MASHTSPGTGQAVNLDGVSAFSLKDRAAFLGLELEYVPPSQGLFSEAQCASIVRRLEQVEYTEVVTKGKKDEAATAAAAYAWFADRGDWVLMLDKAQENALVPFAHTDWLRGIGWSIFERIKSFQKNGTGFVGGGNAALVTWLRGSDVQQQQQQQQQRLGANCPNWFSDYPVTTVYVYFSDDHAGGKLAVSFSPGSDVASRKFFVNEDTRKEGVQIASALNLQLHNGSILIVRDERSHRHWDLSVKRSGTIAGGYFVAFQTISTLRVHQEHSIRPPIRTKRGLSLQRRIVPAHEREPPLVANNEEEKDDDDEEDAKRVKRPPPPPLKGKRKGKK